MCFPFEGHLYRQMMVRPVACGHKYKNIMGLMSIPKRIAVVGSGISGLSAAYFLKDHHDVHLFEKEERPGGHSNTVVVDMAGQSLPVDTGFIVFNYQTYPNLVKFFEHLHVPIVASDMSFSVSMGNGELEYAGTNLDTLFCQRSNLGNLDFLRMVWDIFYFNRMAQRESINIGYEVTLEEFLSTHGFSQAFRDLYLYPMASAIWSMPMDGAAEYPARTLIDFFDNHGLLRAINQHPWYTVKDGSRGYVDKLISQLGNVHLGCEVKKVLPEENGIRLITSRGEEMFDEVVLATDGASPLGLLEKPTSLQEDVLGGFKVSMNKAYLHWDTTLMPKRKKAWASWNYLMTDREGVSLSYWMNRLQGLSSEHPLIVTLNPAKAPDSEKVFYETEYMHPLFDATAVEMQRRIGEIQGQGHVWYAGAYQGYGFHEDGLESGMRVAKELGGTIPWEE